MYTQKKKLPPGKGQTNGSSSTKQVKNNFRAISFKPSRIFNQLVKNISLQEVIGGRIFISPFKFLLFIGLSHLDKHTSSFICLYSSFLTYAFLSSFHSSTEVLKETHDWRSSTMSWCSGDYKICNKTTVHYATKTNLFCISLKKRVGRYLECKSSQHLRNVWLPIQGIFLFTHRRIANRCVHIIYDTDLN